MSVEFEMADAILAIMKGCLDCTAYERFPITVGDPPVECSMLGVGIQNFDPLAQVAQCAVHGLNVNLVISQCCYPVGGNDGSPPSAEALSKVSLCLTNDVEAVLCCLAATSLEIQGAVKPCRPVVNTVRYDRPQGGCVSAKINATFSGVPCCG